MGPEENFYTTRFVRKASSSSAGASIFAIIGIFCIFFINWILGLILLLIGIALSGSSKKISTCGECGNEVANTSRMCPHCHAGFDRVQKVAGSRAVLYATIGSLSVFGLIGVGLWWIINNANR